MYAEAREQPARITVIAVVVRAVIVDNRHPRSVVPVRANGLIPKEFIFCLLFEHEPTVTLSSFALGQASQVTVVMLPYRA